MGRGTRAYLPVAGLVAVACLGLAGGAWAKVEKGPKGLAFYDPPKLKGAAHGAPLWARSLKGTAALTPSGGNRLVLYRSLDHRDRSVAVSGTITVPEGEPPKGGWPILAYGHGTTGIADQCAPSRDTETNPAHLYISYIYPFLDEWVEAGYAVVRSDFQGLGTPGTHGFLAGAEEGRAILDLAKAARKVDPEIGKQVVIAGHSQGGHAALWAAALESKYNRDLDVRGTVAFAPASHIEEQAKLIGALSAPGGGLSGLAALILRGVSVAHPELEVAKLLAPEAKALFPDTLTECEPQLAEPDSFGGIAPADLLRSGVDAESLYAALGESDPETLKIKRPLLIAQGSADGTVYPFLTDQLVEELEGRGADLDYRTYEGVDHGTIPTAALDDALQFADSRLR